ncbi:hypothetical protein LCGC14_2692550, partial [marine sediment metagenome]
NRGSPQVVSSKDKARLSCQLQPLPSDWWAVFDLEDYSADRESVRCARIPILETDKGLLDQIEHLELHELLEIEVGFHARPDLGVQAIHVEPATKVLVDDLTRPVDPPAAVQRMVGGLVVNDWGEDLVDGRKLLLAAINLVDVDISFIVVCQHPASSSAYPSQGQRRQAVGSPCRFACSPVVDQPQSLSSQEEAYPAPGYPVNAL